METVWIAQKCIIKTWKVGILQYSAAFEMWQSRVEIEHCSVVYFNCITAFEVLQAEL